MKDLDPHDPAWIWLHAANLAAHAAEASRWDWRPDSIERLELAQELAELVYQGRAEEPRVLEIIVRLGKIIGEHSCLTIRDSDRPTGLKWAFLGLRYVLFNEGQRLPEGADPGPAI